MNRMFSYARHKLVLLLLALFFIASNELIAAEFSNHIGMVFVEIPAGSYFMGSCVYSELNEAERNKRIEFVGGSWQSVICPSGAELIDPADQGLYPNVLNAETPQHKVQIRGFQIGKFEVTLGQFKKYVLATGRFELISNEFIKNNPNGDNAAVSWLTWYDAQDFVSWLNQSKPTSDRGVYRLPSEAEWEYVARSGSITQYHFAEDAAQLPSYAWYEDNVGKAFNNAYAQLVGQKKGNALGVYDLLGNVFEWTQDCWNDNYQSAPFNGKAWETGNCSKRVIRGGAWNSSARSLRSADREGIRADLRSVSYPVGIRVVRAVQ